MATETKAAHTLGPWHVFPGRPGIFNDCDVIVSEHCEDAIVCAMGHDLPGVDANARLIAAAPELLVAAKAAWSWCHQGGPADWALIQGFAVLLRAAIQKAEGA